MKYNTFLFDLDNTLLDTFLAEKIAIDNTLNEYNIKLTPEILNAYRQFNSECWGYLEQGIYSKQQILILRFEKLINYLNINIEPSLLNDKYMFELSNQTKIIDNADNLLKFIKINKGLIYIVSNGTRKVQYKRLKNSCLINYVDDTFLSDELGYQKPNAKFFIKIEQILNIKFDNKTLLIGDSLTSDIKGANNYNLQCAWYNRFNITNNNCKINFEFNNLMKLIDFIV